MRHPLVFKAYSHVRRNARDDRGQGAMLIVVAMLVALSVIPVMTVTQTLDELPIMTHANLLVEAQQAARSGLEIVMSAAEQDPLDVWKKFPSPSSSIENLSECQSGVAASQPWHVIAQGNPSRGQPEEEALVAVDPPKNGVSGPVTVFSEGRAGSPGHFVCDEEKLRTSFIPPVINGPAPGTFASYPVPSWATGAYVSMAGAWGGGCTVNDVYNVSGCAAYNAVDAPSGGPGAEFTAWLPFPDSGLGGSIAIGVGAIPDPELPTGSQLGSDPEPSYPFHGGASNWLFPTGSGLSYFVSKFGDQQATASFPGGGATMIYYCPASSSCSPNSASAFPLAVAGGGGGSGSAGISISSFTLFPGSDGGPAGVVRSGTCISSPGCYKLSSSSSTYAGSGYQGGIGESSVQQSCTLNLGIFGEVTTYYSGGGGGGGYAPGGGAGLAGAAGSNVTVFGECLGFNSSQGGGGGASYVEDGAKVIQSSLAPPSRDENGFAQLWFSGTHVKPTPTPTSSCGQTSGQYKTVYTNTSDQAQDVALLVAGSEGAPDRRYRGGSGAEFPVLAYLPSDDSIACAPVQGGQGGDAGFSVPTPAGNGGTAADVCVVSSSSPGTCTTPLVIAGGGGGAGDAGGYGASWCSLFSICGNWFGGKFLAGTGGEAGYPLHTVNLVGSSTTNAQAGQAGRAGGLGSFTIPSWVPIVGGNSYSLEPSAGGSGGSSSGSPTGTPGGNGNPQVCEVFSFQSWNNDSYIGGGGGGGGGGYAGGGGGGAGKDICEQLNFLGVSFGGVSGGGGGGGGSSWENNATPYLQGVGYGWPNPTSAYGVEAIGIWSAEYLSGPQLISSACVGETSWNGRCS